MTYLLQVQNPMSKIVGSSQFFPCLSLFFPLGDPLLGFEFSYAFWVVNLLLCMSVSLLPGRYIIYILLSSSA